MIPKEMIEAAAMRIAYELGYTWGSSGLDHEALMRAAEAALSVHGGGMESAERIAGYNAGLEDAARHCERNALSAVPVEIRSLKRPLPPPPAQE